MKNTLQCHGFFKDFFKKMKTWQICHVLSRLTWQQQINSTHWTSLKLRTVLLLSVIIYSVVIAKRFVSHVTVPYIQKPGTRRRAKRRGSALLRLSSWGVAWTSVTVYSLHGQSSLYNRQVLAFSTKWNVLWPISSFCWKGDKFLLAWRHISWLDRRRMSLHRYKRFNLSASIYEFWKIKDCVHLLKLAHWGTWLSRMAWPRFSSAIRLSFFFT